MLDAYTMSSQHFVFRFLSTGDSYHTIAFSYRVGLSTIAGIVTETCEKLWECLAPTYMKVPDEHEWKERAQVFARRWNFPNCIGAIDGKHVMIQAPPKSGSLFFNYKKTFSIVLLAVVDARYCFTLIDVGAYGWNSDAEVLKESNLGKLLVSGGLHIPPDSPLAGAEELGNLPHVIVGDEAFRLRRYLMRPYPGRNNPEDERIFNYRLSGARRIVENAFGILVARC